jgi:hypothetical protein
MLLPIQLEFPVPGNCEGESVNASQIDIKRKTFDIRNWGKRLFLDVPSTSIDTLVHSLYQRAETRSI